MTAWYGANNSSGHREPSEWPDGTVAARYGFVHALYQEVLYDAALGQSAQFVCIGRLVSAKNKPMATERREIAAELAVHFERGRDYQASNPVSATRGRECQCSAQPIWKRSALLTKGLELLKTLPDTPERTQQELTLQIALGAPLMATKGFAAPEVENAYARARELCQRTGETSQLFPILRGLWEFYGLRGEYQTAQELGEQLLALAQRQPDPALLLVAHNVLGDHLVLPGGV